MILHPWDLLHQLVGQLFIRYGKEFLISLLLAVILIFVDKKKTKLRSNISYLALIFLFAISIRTFMDLNKSENNSFLISTSNNITVGDKVSTDETINLIKSFTSENRNSVILRYTNLLQSFLSSNIYKIVLLWLTGIIILSLRLMGGIVYSQRLKIGEIAPVNKLWEEIIEKLLIKFEISKNVKLLQSKLVKSPLTIGYFKPVILLPLGMIAGIPQNQLEIILAHEIAHIKRADYILNIFQSIIEVFFFFNPAVWWISKTIRREREYLCDDIAIDICGNSITLAKALLYIQNSDFTKTRIAMASTGNKNSLMGRIKRMTKSNNERKAMRATLTIIPLLIFLLFMACSSLDSKVSKKSDKFAESAKTASQPATSTFTKSTEVGSVAIASISAPHDEVTSASVASSFSHIAKVNIIPFINLLDDEKRMHIIFQENDISWEAYFEDDKLVKLFKDGTKIPANDFSKYEDLVYEKYNEFKEDMVELDFEMDELKIDLEQLKMDLAELKEIEFDFNSEEFANEIREMKHELNEGLEELKDLDIDINIDFNFDELNDNFKKIKIDLSGFDDDMATMEIELKELKKELIYLKNFLSDLKDELVKDGYLENDDEDFDLVLSKTKIVVNDERLPNELHKKYLDLYKDHYGKDLDKTFRISN